MPQSDGKKPKYGAGEIQPNSFNLIGRICSFEDFQSRNGNLVVKLKISKKSSNSDTYDLFEVTFFDTDKNLTASNILSEFEKNDYIGVKGYMRINKFTPANSDKERWEKQLIGTSYQKMVYDTEINKYVKVA